MVDISFECREISDQIFERVDTSFSTLPVPSLAQVSSSWQAIREADYLSKANS